MEASALPININSLGDLETVFNSLMAGEDIRIENIKLNFFNSIDFKIYGLSVLLRACASFLQGRIDDCQYITGNCDFVVCV